MVKIRLKWIQIVEYEPDPANYAEGSRIHQMADVDLEGAKYDPELVFQDSSSVEYIEEITVEVIEST